MGALLNIKSQLVLFTGADIYGIIIVRISITVIISFAKIQLLSLYKGDYFNGPTKNNHKRTQWQARKCYQIRIIHCA